MYASVSYGCCKSRSEYCICCNGYRRMLQVSIQNISSTSDVCCKCFIWMLHMLQWLYAYVGSACSNCFICFKCMLQEVLPYCKCFMSSAGSPRRRWWPSCVRYKCCKSRSGCRLFYNGYTRMLQVSIQKCFIYFRCMLPLASAFIWMLYMLQCYTHVLLKCVQNVSSASDVCYRKCFHVASVS
jgi:hypothetical protein